MRIPVACLLLTVWLHGPVAAFQEQPEAPPLQNLLSSKEWRDYQKDARYKERMKVFRKAFERWEEILEKQARDRQHQGMSDTLASMRYLSQYAYHEPTLDQFPKDRRAKKTKKLEITLRKLISFLEDLRFQFPYEMEEDLQEARRDLERLREQLLAGIFGRAFQPEAEEGSNSSEPPPPGSGLSAMLMSLSGSPAGASLKGAIQRRRQGVRGDQFTEEEFDLIRLNQGLGFRVDVFLDIAESRIVELTRRLKDEEYVPEASDKEDAKRIEKNRKQEEKRRKAEAEGGEKAENPLLFFTPPQLVQAYERAMDGITINVDDAYKRQAASEDAIRAVMKKLDKKAPDYLKQIQEFKKVAVETRDEPLYRELLEAEKITEVAIEGSRHFLEGSE